jgi:hypothetical protein
MVSEQGVHTHIHTHKNIHTHTHTHTYTHTHRQQNTATLLFVLQGEYKEDSSNVGHATPGQLLRAAEGLKQQLQDAKERESRLLLDLDASKVQMDEAAEALRTIRAAFEVLQDTTTMLQSKVSVLENRLASTQQQATEALQSSLHLQHALQECCRQGEDMASTSTATIMNLTRGLEGKAARLALLYTEAAERESNMLSQIHELSTAVRAAQEREERVEEERESEEKEYEAAMQEQSKKLLHLEAHMGQKLTDLQAHMGQQECLWQQERDASRRENARTEKQFSEQCSVLRKEAKEAERDLHHECARAEQRAASLQEQCASVSAQAHHAQQQATNEASETEAKYQGQVSLLQQQLQDTARLLQESIEEKKSLKDLLEEYEAEREHMEEEVLRRRAHAEVLLKLSSRRITNAANTTSLANAANITSLSNAANTTSLSNAVKPDAFLQRSLHSLSPTRENSGKGRTSSSGGGGGRGGGGGGGGGGGEAAMLERNGSRLSTSRSQSSRGF